MGLDASVFCNCYEKNRVKCPPPHPELVYLYRDGALDCRSDDPKVVEAFDRWRKKACRHEEGYAAGEYLGNMWYIPWVREGLSRNFKRFPVLVYKVLYSGTHCGDWLTIRDVRKLEKELERLEAFHCGKEELDHGLQRLRRQLQKLVRVALKLGKPIAF
jgi:hypothetical protein